MIDFFHKIAWAKVLKLKVVWKRNVTQYVSKRQLMYWVLNRGYVFILNSEQQIYCLQKWLKKNSLVTNPW